MSHDRLVQSVAQGYLNNARGDSLGEKVDNAWDAIDGWRLGNCRHGLHIVAAEHYLFMRSVCRRPRIAEAWGMAVMGLVEIPLYELYKKISFALGVMPFRESECPPSHPSVRVSWWAYTGITDGVRDTQRGPTDWPSVPGHPNWFGQRFPLFGRTSAGPGPSVRMQDHPHVHTLSGDRYY